MKKTERCSVLLKDLKFNDDNPRKISKDKMDDLKRSITTLGNFKDIVIDEANKIWAGNSRCRAMIEMGIEIPISATRILGYSDKEKKAIAVKDNHHEGQWDFDKLDSWDDDLKEYDFMGSEFNFDGFIKDKEIKEKEIDLLETDKRCPKCGYSW